MRTIPLAAALLLLLGGGTPQENTPTKPLTVAQQKQLLQSLPDLVGQWRGVGQPQRGSSRGSWTEQLEWEWHFAPGKATLQFQSDNGKYFGSGVLRALGGAVFELRAVTPAQKTVVYRGQLAEGVLTLLAEQTAVDDQPARITLRLVARGKRLLILLERPIGNSPRFSRLAEVGYTRKGSEFAKAQSGRECIVTGGQGTIEVSYQGKTYYVCCGGCRDYFNADPAAAIAEYEQRRAGN